MSEKLIGEYIYGCELNIDSIIHDFARICVCYYKK